MGFYLGCTAVRTDDLDMVRDAVVRYAARYAVETELTTGEHPTSDCAGVYPPESGWTVVIWPHNFGGTWPAARWLSADLATAASAVEVVAGSYWTHAAFDAGTMVDQFSVIPDNNVPFNLEGDDAAIARIRAELAGNAHRLATLFNRPADVIDPYLVHVLTLDLPDDIDPQDLPKAHPDDEFDLCDCWVFADFWRRMGITYPDQTLPACLIRFTTPGHSSLPTTLD